MNTPGSVLLAPSPAPKYDLSYYLKGAAAGGICCSITHGALTPVDVVKTRVQLDSVKVRLTFLYCPRSLLFCCFHSQREPRIARFISCYAQIIYRMDNCQERMLGCRETSFLKTLLYFAKQSYLYSSNSLTK